MTIKMSAAVAAVTFACATPAAAQVVIEANGARADDRWGGELGIGYSLPIGAGFRVTAAGGALIYAGDNDRYSFDNNGGSPRCRDHSNGQYADSGDCNNTAAKAYGRVEASYSIPISGLSFGAGARFGSEVRPYGTIAAPIAPHLQLRGNGGPDYYAAGLRFAF